LNATAPVNRHLQVDGYRVIRITYRQLHDDAPTIAAQLRALLADRLSSP
jgi:very-short-patch-repair endonuclease